ncbi:hypothetical protein HN784_04480 [bacterium]|jgi:hypothetical protein|nr:hypothetical protein [bacterium]MBT4251430.1 hypothetical protein [bacterium]MBT4597404.1 hypothetical protein [bacterium]MBT6754243.1 hypothetical protein [bacterium]MBT7037569.1 hypothetical protein [bacterium]
MSETLRFARRVEERYDGKKIKIEKMGTRSFQITTSSAAEFDFRNRIWTQRFDQDFISQLNQFLKEDQQLDMQDRDVYHSLNDLHQKLQDDVDHFDFKISFRMTS